MKQKKYKLTKETMCFDGVTLHMKFAKPNMPTHWMKIPTHP